MTDLFEKDDYRDHCVEKGKWLEPKIENTLSEIVENPDTIETGIVHASAIAKPVKIKTLDDLYSTLENVFESVCGPYSGSVSVAAGYNEASVVSDGRELAFNLTGIIDNPRLPIMPILNHIADMARAVDEETGDGTTSAALTLLKLYRHLFGLKLGGDWDCWPNQSKRLALREYRKLFDKKLREYTVVVDNPEDVSEEHFVEIQGVVRRLIRTTMGYEEKYLENIILGEMRDKYNDGVFDGTVMSVLPSFAIRVLGSAPVPSIRRSPVVGYYSPLKVVNAGSYTDKCRINAIRGNNMKLLILSTNTLNQPEGNVLTESNDLFQKIVLRTIEAVEADPECDGLILLYPCVPNWLADTITKNLTKTLLPLNIDPSSSLHYDLALYLTATDLNNIHWDGYYPKELNSQMVEEYFGVNPETFEVVNPEAEHKMWGTVDSVLSNATGTIFRKTGTEEAIADQKAFLEELLAVPNGMVVDNQKMIIDRKTRLDANRIGIELRIVPADYSYKLRLDDVVGMLENFRRTGEVTIAGNQLAAMVSHEIVEELGEEDQCLKHLAIAMSDVHIELLNLLMGTAHIKNSAEYKDWSVGQFFDLQSDGCKILERGKTLKDNFDELPITAASIDYAIMHQILNKILTLNIKWLLSFNRPV